MSSNVSASVGTYNGVLTQVTTKNVDNHAVKNTLSASRFFADDDRTKVVHDAFIKCAISKEEVESIVPLSLNFSTKGTIKLTVTPASLSSNDFSPIAQLFESIFSKNSSLPSAHIQSAARLIKDTIAVKVCEVIKANPDLHELMYLKPFLGGQKTHNVGVSGDLNDRITGVRLGVTGSVNMVAFCGPSLLFNPRRRLELAFELESRLLQIDMNMAQAWAATPGIKEKVESSSITTNILTAGQKKT